jgi:hypothetical protein
MRWGGGVRKVVVMVYCKILYLEEKMLEFFKTNAASKT